MCEEAFHEEELRAVGGADKRTLVVRGGYGREEVFIGICRTSDDMPDEVIAVDGRELLSALRSMGLPAPKKRAKR